MKLIITQKELEELMEEGFVSPNLEDSNSYLLTLLSVTDEVKELEVLLSEPSNYNIPTKVNKPVSNNGHSTIEDWIDSWRAAWKGTRVKGMGSREKCVQSMQEFFQLYPHFTQDHVFKARDRYFQSLDGNYTYLEQADYFIKKRVPSNDNGIETRRTLLVYCEELLIDEEIGIEDSFSLFDDIN